MDFKTLGGLGGLLAQAGRMREEMQKLQESLAARTVEGSAGGGMIKVTANGKQQILSILIDPEAMKLNDREMLQDLVRAGVNQAITASQEMVAEEMKKFGGGLDLGGLLDQLKK